MDIKYNEFIISDNKKMIQIDRVHELLSDTYWAQNRSIECIRKSIENSMCFGVYFNGNQIGFGRCVTDYTIIYWLADIVIDKTYRKSGLGKALVKAIVEHEQLKSLTGILATNDAHGLYEKFGFQLSDGRFMRRPERTGQV